MPRAAPGTSGAPPPTTVRPPLSCPRLRPARRGASGLPLPSPLLGAFACSSSAARGGQQGRQPPARLRSRIAAPARTPPRPSRIAAPARTLPRPLDATPAACRCRHRRLVAHPAGPTRCPHPRPAPNPARQPGPAAIAGEAGLLRPVGPWIADPRLGTQLVSSRLGSKSLGQCTAGMLRFDRLMPRPCAPRTSHRPCVPQPPPPCAVPALPGPRRRPAARRWTCVTWRTGSRWTKGAATLCPVGWG